MAAATAELTLADECYARAVEAGFTEQELSTLRRTLAKKSDEQILAGIANLSKWSGKIDAYEAVSLLYSVTDAQMANLEWSVKIADGWD